MAWFLLAALLTSAACSGSPNPNVNPLQPSADPPPAAPSGPSNATPIILGEVAEITLDLTVSSGGTYCEIGNDPAPCARFVIDVPRDGTLVIRMEFEMGYPMYIELPIHQMSTSSESPLIARKAVKRGLVNFTVGLNQGWGLRGKQVRLRLIPTLEGISS